MTSAAINTKIESVVEAVEDLANAIIDGRNTDTADADGVDKVTADILDKRTALRNGLAAFLQPALRVIQGGLATRQGYTPDTEEADKPLCETCLRKRPCLMNGPNCQHWAAAVRKKHNEGTGLSEPGNIA